MKVYLIHIRLPLVSDQRPVTKRMERVHPIQVYHHSTRLVTLFWSEFAKVSIEYRYNDLFFPQKSHRPSTEVCVPVFECKDTKK